MRLLLSYILLFMGCSAEKLKRFEVSKQRTGGDRDAADADNAAPSSGFKKKIKPFNPDIAGFKPKSGSDPGILFRKQSTSSRRLVATCTDESVICDNGVSGNETCKDACQGRCCVGESACDDFTGELCKDNVTCVGDKACEYAKIGLVVNGCNGNSSCYYAGGHGGSIGEVYNSCLGYFACYRAADEEIGGLGGGSIGVIQDSCLGYKACAGAAADGGNIGSISSSCNGTYSCFLAAAYGGGIGGMVYNSCLGQAACFRAAFDGGYIGGISSSCNGTRSCLFAAAYGGSIGVIQDSCFEYIACALAAFESGNIGSISSSCNGTQSCYRAAAYGGSIGGIVDSCLEESACALTAACANNKPQCGSSITEIIESCEGEKACSYAANDGGYIGGMKNACNAKEACLRAATFGQDRNISSGINDCCNTISVCYNITEATLPDKCGTTAPTTAPTPTRSSKGSKSKTNKSKTGKKIPFGKGGKKNNDWKRDEFASVVDGCMSLHTEKSVFDKR